MNTEKDYIVEIQEEVRLPQGDSELVLEKGDKIGVREIARPPFTFKALFVNGQSLTKCTIEGYTNLIVGSNSCKLCRNNMGSGTTLRTGEPLWWEHTRTIRCKGIPKTREKIESNKDKGQTVRNITEVIEIQEVSETTLLYHGVEYPIQTKEGIKSFFTAMVQDLPDVLYVHMKSTSYSSVDFVMIPKRVFVGSGLIRIVAKNSSTVDIIVPEISSGYYNFMTETLSIRLKPNTTIDVSFTKEI